MKAFLRHFTPAVATAALALTPVAARAGSITMSATYYTVGETDQDMNHLAGGVFSNEVQNGLGADGLPLLNTAAFGCTSGCFTSTPLPADLSSSGEITWWSPTLNTGGPGGVSDVVKTGSGTITLPYSNGSFYPPNGSGPDDAHGFQSAVFSTTLNVPTTESISFNVGADDAAFVYLDGQIACDLGGVHGDSVGSCTSSTLAAGPHTLQLFFADLEQVGAALDFSVTTSGVTGVPTTGVPEPASLALLGGGLSLFAIIRRRARKA